MARVMVGRALFLSLAAVVTALLLLHVPATAAACTHDSGNSKCKFLLGPGVCVPQGNGFCNTNTCFRGGQFKTCLGFCDFSCKTEKGANGIPTGNCEPRLDCHCGCPAGGGGTCHFLNQNAADGGEAATTSAKACGDPHLTGFNSQKFNFQGAGMTEEGKGRNYALVYDPETSFWLAAHFSEPSGIPTRPDNTYMTDIAIEIPAPAPDQTPIRLIVQHKGDIAGGMPAFGNNGGAYFADNGTRLEGANIIGGGIVVSVSEGSVIVIAESLGIRVTVLFEAAHVNVGMSDTLGLSASAHGVLGQTARVRYDSNGVPVTHGTNEHGAGLLYGTDADYEVEDIFGVEEFSARLPALQALEEEEEKVAIPSGYGSSYRRSLVEVNTATNKARQQDRLAYTHMRADYK